MLEANEGIHGLHDICVTACKACPSHLSALFHIVCRPAALARARRSSPARVLLPGHGCSCLFPLLRLTRQGIAFLDLRPCEEHVETVAQVGSLLATAPQHVREQLAIRGRGMNPQSPPQGGGYPAQQQQQQQLRPGMGK